MKPATRLAPTPDIRIAIDFAAEHAEDVQARIQANQAAVEARRRAVDQRHALLA